LPSPDRSPECNFNRQKAGTIGRTLDRSCTSELTRQGIWLPFSQAA
jgi:hypothetical protein